MAFCVPLFCAARFWMTIAFQRTSRQNRNDLLPVHTMVWLKNRAMPHVGIKKPCEPHVFDLISIRIAITGS